MANNESFLLSRVDAVDLDTGKNLFSALQDVDPLLRKQEFLVVLMGRMGIRAISDLNGITDFSYEALITAPVKTFIDETHDVVRQLFGRKKYTDNYVTELRAILREYNVKLMAKRVQGDRARDEFGIMSKGTSTQLYSIDMDSLSRRLELSQQVIDNRNSKKQENTHND